MSCVIIRVCRYPQQTARGIQRVATARATAWTLRHPAVTAAIVGFRSPEQVAGVIGAMEFRITQKEIEEIEEFKQRLAARMES